MLGREEFNMGKSRTSPVRLSPRLNYPVVLTQVNTVGLRLATGMLEAGYVVFGQEVSADCRAEFLAAGGKIAGGNFGEGDAAWSIDCQECPDVGPETLSKAISGRSTLGRPRLEIIGSQHVLDESLGQSVASLVVRGPGDPQAELLVTIGVSSRGPELTVRGGHTLFEEALPLLMTFSGRVLYAGPGRDTPTNAG